MGRGPVVQARKEAVNNAKGKIFSLHAKLISLAAQKWGNPDDNPTLATAVYEAKKAWVPNENIARAIKKWSGEDSSLEQIQEIIYEWYASGGIALLVNCLTDNKNRTVANIRHIFWKYGGNLGESGSVSWMFEKKGVIFINPILHSYESIENNLYDLRWLEDIMVETEYIKLITSLEEFSWDIQYLEWLWIEIMESKIDYIPNNEIEIKEHEQVLKLTKMLQAFEEDEDVNYVSSNEIIAPELQAEVDKFIEKHSFRT